MIYLLFTLQQQQQQAGRRVDVLHGNLLTHVSGKLLCNVSSIPFVTFV